MNKVLWELSNCTIPARHMASTVEWNHSLYCFGGFGVATPKTGAKNILTSTKNANNNTDTDSTKNTNKDSISNNETALVHLNELWKFTGGGWFEIKKGHFSGWPSARFGHSAVVYEKKMYIFGGINEKGQLLDDLWSCDLRNYSWSQIKYKKGAFEIGAVGHTAVVYNDQMYVFGKRGFLVYSFQKKEWRQVKSKNCPAPREFHTANLYHNSMVIFGGHLDNQNLNDLHFFSFQTEEWRQITYAKQIQKRQGHKSALLLGRFLIIHGGRDTQGSLGDLLALDCFKETWVSDKFMQSQCLYRYHHSFIFLDSDIYLIGGFGFNEKQPKSKNANLGEVWRFANPAAIIDEKMKQITIKYPEMEQTCRLINVAPDVLTTNILVRLDAKSLACLNCTCRFFFHLAGQYDLWKLVAGKSRIEYGRNQMARIQQKNAPNLKLLVLGPSGSGRISLIYMWATNVKLKGNCLKTSYLSQLQCWLNDQYDTWMTRDDTYRKQVEYSTGQWAIVEAMSDPSQEEFSIMHDEYIRHADIFALVFPITDHKRFEELPDFVRKICRVRDEDEENLRKVPAVLVGLKSDLEDQREVSQQEAQLWAENQHIPYIEASSKHRLNVDSVFTTAVNQYFSLFEQPKPKKKKNDCLIF